MFIPVAILLLLLSVLHFGTDAAISNAKQQPHCCNCPCCICQNIYEPGKRLTSEALSNGSGANAGRDGSSFRKGVQSTPQFEDSSPFGVFQNLIPFVPPSGESQAMTEVARPPTDIGNDMVPDLDPDLVPSTNSQTLSIPDTESNRQVTINRTLPAPVNDFAVEQFFREKNSRKSGNAGQDQSFSEIPRNPFLPSRDRIRPPIFLPSSANSISQDYDDNRNKAVTKKNTTSRAPEVRAQSCGGTSCSDDGGTTDYDPYLLGTFSGTRAEAPWPPSQEPKANEPKVAPPPPTHKQSALEYYDEIKQERNSEGRTTFAPQQQQEPVDFDFLDITPENTCRLCSSGNLQELPPPLLGEQQPQQAALTSFAGKYGSSVLDFGNSEAQDENMLAVNSSSIQQTKNINDNNFQSIGSSRSDSGQETRDPENPRFLEPFSLINLTEKLNTVTAAHALPLVGDFQLEDRTLSPIISFPTAPPKKRRKPEVSPPSLMALERRLNNDTVGNPIKPTNLAGVTTKADKTIQVRSALAPVKETLVVRKVPITAPPEVQKLTPKAANRSTDTQLRVVLNGTTNSTEPIRYPQPSTTTFQFPDIKIKPERKLLEDFQTLDKFRSETAVGRDITDNSVRLFLHPSTHWGKPNKLLDTLTTLSPVEDTLLYPPLDQHLLGDEEIGSRKLVRTRKAKLFY